jgi:hypothetical protein
MNREYSEMGKTKLTLMLIGNIFLIGFIVALLPVVWVGVKIGGIFK